MYRQRISGVYYSTVEPRVVGLVPAGFLAKNPIVYIRFFSVRYYSNTSLKTFASFSVSFQCMSSKLIMVNHNTPRCHG